MVKCVNFSVVKRKINRGINLRINVNRVKNDNLNIMVSGLILFYIAWSIKELWLIEAIYSFGDIISPLVEATVKSVLWIVPAYLYIKYVLQKNVFGYLKMDVLVTRGLVWGSILSLILGIGLFTDAYIFNNASIQFSLSLDDYLNTVLMAGLAEEIVFRGFILQEINKRVAFWKSNIITSFLFLIIHYPIWIYNDIIFNYGSHFYVFMIGLLFGYVFKKTGSLWSVILLHAFHNFIFSIL